MMWRERVRRGGPALFAAGLVVLLAASCGGRAAHPPPSAQIERADNEHRAFLRLREVYLRGDYEATMAAAERFEARWPQSTYLPQALLLRAEAAWRRGRYAQVLEVTGRFLERYGEMPLASSARSLAERARRTLGRGAPAQTAGPERSEPPRHAALEQAMERGAPARRPLRAMQVLLFEARSRRELDREFRRLRQAGFNAIILRVFQNRGDRPYRLAGPKAPEVGVYFASTTAPVVYDLLTDVVEIAARYDLDVYAWMTTRYFDWLTAQRPGLLDTLYDPTSGALRPARGVAIHHPEVRAHARALYRELASYPIAGILLQDDLALRQREGFAASEVKAYRDATGKPLDPSRVFADFDTRGRAPRLTRPGPDYDRWIDFKVEGLLDYAEELIDVARQVQPALEIMMNLYYETAWKKAYGREWLAQDLDAASRRDVDVLALMTYHRQIDRELQLGPEKLDLMLRSMAVRARRAVSTPARLALKLEVRDWATGETIGLRELGRVIRSLAADPHVGWIAVPYHRRLDVEGLGRLLRSLGEPAAAGVTPGRRLPDGPRESPR